MKITVTAALGAAAIATPHAALAQPAEPAPAAASAPTAPAPSITQAAPIVAQPVEARPAVALPANTEILLSMNEALDSRRNHEHDTFRLSVVNNVMLGNYVVIPAGTRAVGEITWMTGRGMFGKSGKMDIALRYIELDGRQIPIEGTYRQEGEGNTVATVASVVLVAPVVGFFITGHSAVVPQGRQLTARTTNALAVALPEGASLQPTAVQASLPVASEPPAAPAPAAAPVAGAIAGQQ